LLQTPRFRLLQSLLAVHWKFAEMAHEAPEQSLSVLQGAVVCAEQFLH